MSGRTRHQVERLMLDQKTRAKIVDLFRNHGVNRSLLVERFGCSLTEICQVLREAGVSR